MTTKSLLNRAARLQTWLIAIVVIGAAVLYFYVDPSATRLMPKCPVLMLTGLECPSCGAQRAFHAALHLRFGEALGYNPFMLLSVPYFLLAVYVFWLKGPGGEGIRRRLFSEAAVYVYVALWTAWWVIRNVI
ncbi:MAG: DUF2752 domain-containing protein [Muribaculaceae bacterium]|nr:DUF2752 domain-containing protein [Muribaculaceae bacterium]